MGAYPSLAGLAFLQSRWCFKLCFRDWNSRVATTDLCAVGDVGVYCKERTEDNEGKGQEHDWENEGLERGLGKRDEQECMCRSLFKEQR